VRPTAQAYSVGWPRERTLAIAKGAF